MNRLSAAILAFALMLLVSPRAKSDDISSRQRRIDNLKKDVELLEGRLRQNEIKQGSAIERLDLVRAKITAEKSLVKESDREISAYRDSIRRCTREIRTLQARLDTLTTYYSHLVRNAYKNRDAKIWYIYILASEDIGQAFRRIGYLKNLSATMSAQARKIAEAREEMKVHRSRLQNLQGRAEAVKLKRQADLKALQKDENSEQKLIASLKTNASKYKKEVDAKRKEVERLNKELERIRREALSSAKKASKGKNAENVALSKEFAANKGKLPWPAEGPVIQGFGVNSYPSAKHSLTMKNNGINVAMQAGAKVSAVFGGKVIKTFDVKGYGHCVVISHGGYMTMYCRLGAVSVKTGEAVATGQAIGKIDTIVGETYLHFEICDPSGNPVNPELWLR